MYRSRKFLQGAGTDDRSEGGDCGQTRTRIGQSDCEEVQVARSQARSVYWRYVSRGFSIGFLGFPVFI